MLGIALSICFVIFRLLWSYKLPCHGDLGYFVDPRCIHNKRYYFRGTIITRLYGCFRVVAMWWYETIWLLSKDYQQFKRLKSLASSTLMLGAGATLASVGQTLGLNPSIVFVVWLLANMDLPWGGYMITADKLSLCLMPFVAYLWLANHWVLAFAVVAIDVFGIKPTSVTMYAPLVLYSMLQPHRLLEIWGPLLLGLLAWNVWLRINHSNMKTAFAKTAMLNSARISRPKRPVVLEVYYRKLKRLAHQLLWAPAIPLLAFGVLLFEKPPLLVILLLWGVVLSWCYQRGRNWYYILPALAPLSLLVAQAPPILLMLGVLLWGRRIYDQVKDASPLFRGLRFYHHIRGCKVLEENADLIEPGATLELRGVFTCAWFITNTVCLDATLMGWGSNTTIGLYGLDTSKWVIPGPSADYVVISFGGEVHPDYCKYVPVLYDEAVMVLKRVV